MNRRFSVTIDDKLYEALMAESAKLDLTPNKYTAVLLAEKLQPIRNDMISDTDSVPVATAGRRRNYTLDLADASLLKKKASALGLCDTAYLRMLIRTKDFRKIDYTVDDLFAYLSEHQKAIDSLHSFVELIRNNGKGVVFEPDIRRIIQLSEEIKAAMLVQVEQTFRNREKVYNEMIRKIENSAYTRERN